MSARKRIRERGGLRLAAFFFLLAAAGLACRQGASRVKIEPGPAAGSSASGAAIPGSGAEKMPQGPFSFTRAETRSLDLFLAKNPNLRLATDADARTSDDSADVARLYGVYHPFFVRGDVNDDGALDFVAGFVDRTKSGAGTWFTIVVFCSDRSGGFREPEILEKEISLERGDISIDRDCVIITPDLGEDANRRYRWNGLRRHFEYVSDDEGSPEPRPINRI